MTSGLSSLVSKPQVSAPTPGGADLIRVPPRGSRSSDRTSTLLEESGLQGVLEDLRKHATTASSSDACECFPGAGSSCASTVSIICIISFVPIDASTRRPRLGSASINKKTTTKRAASQHHSHILLSVLLFQSVSFIKPFWLHTHTRQPAWGPWRCESRFRRTR